MCVILSNATCFYLEHMRINMADNVKVRRNSLRDVPILLEHRTHCRISQPPKRLIQTVSGGNMELNAASEREVFEVKGKEQTTALKGMFYTHLLRERKQRLYPHKI